MRYDFDKIVSLSHSSRAFALAYDAALAGLARLDERLLRLGDSVRSGVEARLDAAEAQSLVGLGGGFLHLNDLILFDADTNVVVPTEDAARGRRLLAQRRNLRRMSSKEIVSPVYLARLAGSVFPTLPHMEPALGGADDAGDQDFDLSSGGDVDQPPGIDLALRAADHQPALMGACLLFDYWRMHEDVGVTETGPFLFSAYLKGRGLARAHLPIVAQGLWRLSPKWHRGDDPARRMTRLTEALRAATQKAMDDTDKLLLARELMMRKLSPKERADASSGLFKLIELFIAEPLVTVDLAARRLKVTPQAVDYLYKKLGSALPREMTGRKRYRAWGI